MKIESMISRDVRTLYMKNVIEHAKKTPEIFKQGGFTEYNRFYNDGLLYAIRSAVLSMTVVHPAMWYEMVMDYQQAITANLSRHDLEQNARAFYNGMFTGFLRIQDVFDEYGLI